MSVNWPEPDTTESPFVFKKLPDNCAEDENTPSAFNLVFTPPVNVEEAVANSILSAFATIPLFADTTFIVLVAAIVPPPVKPVPAVTLTEVWSMWSFAS